jgi:hypothetical protein
MDLKTLEQNDAEIQELYARWLDGLTKAAFVLSLATFVIYVTGILPAYVPLASLPELWDLPLAQYLERTAAPTGWEWVDLIGHGDYLNLAPIALFALVCLVCYARITPLLLRPGARVHAALTIAQVLVLLAAASGALSGGG